MNLNCNCIKNRYMDPMLKDYVQVKNLICNCLIFFRFKYLYNGIWHNEESKILSWGEHARAYYTKTSAHRDLTIYKRTDSGDRFIFNTTILSDKSVCFEVTGTSVHSFINQVPC